MFIIVAMTILLIALNLIVYLWMVFSGVDFFSPTPLQILQWGGCSSSLLLNGEPWRLLTSMFVHFGILHLLMNLYALYDLGSTLEKMIGKVRFLLFYLATGIFGGLVSQIWHLNINSVEAGASGGVFGIVGGLIAFLTTRLFPNEVRLPYLKRILGMVAINLVYGMQASVNMAAHLGGLLSGFVLGYGLYLALVHQKKIIQQISVVMIPLITLMSISGTLKSMKRSDVYQFDQMVLEIQAIQAQILKSHEKMPSDTEEIQDYFKTVLIPEWERGEFLIAQSKHLNLSGDKAKYRDYLEKWVDLNARKYRTWALEIDAIERGEETQLYQNMIKVLDDQLAQLEP